MGGVAGTLRPAMNQVKGACDVPLGTGQRGMMAARGGVRGRRQRHLSLVSKALTVIPSMRTVPPDAGEYSALISSLPSGVSLKAI
jgi:hypothetical protein